jgi:hypothetical protein
VVESSLSSGTVADKTDVLEARVRQNVIAVNQVNVVSITTGINGQMPNDRIVGCAGGEVNQILGSDKSLMVPCRFDNRPRPLTYDLAV